MGIVDTLKDISHESKLDKAEKYSLRMIAKEVQALQCAFTLLIGPGGNAVVADEMVAKATEELQAVLASHWLTGFRESLKQYAWWKDGVQYVGTCGTTLKKALEDASNP